MNPETSYADVVVGLQWGDEGKGKLTNYLAQTGEYNYFIRFGGGPNAGHTIYHKGQKVVTHSIPCGVLHGLTSIIGPGCVINIQKLMQEILDLEALGFPVRENLRIDKRAHIILASHLYEDEHSAITDSIGTTKQGIGPCYKDKYARVGLRAGECNAALGQFLFDIYDLYKEDDVRILFEGAQAFGLDIDWGTYYPYTTSSHCNVGGAINNGIPPQMIRRVYGCAKAYTTYVGNKQFEDVTYKDIFDEVRRLGTEVGTTTGRPRQIGWLDLDMLIQAARINGVTHLIINKIDVLEEVGQFTMIESGQRLDFYNMPDFERYLDLRMKDSCPYLQEIHFSRSPLDI